MSIEESTPFGKYTSSLFEQVLAESKGQNVVMSAFSIYVALLMTGNGSATETREAFHNVLKIDNFASANTDLQDKLSMMQNALANEIFAIANSLFVDSGFMSAIKPDFLSITSDVFQSEVHSVCFANAPPAVQQINSWVENKTNKKIKDLLSPDSVGPLTRMVLVNAIYFKDTWRHVFTVDNTVNKPFYLSETEEIKVPTMHLHGTKFDFGENSEAKWLNIPYKSQEFVMTLVLPQERFGIQKISSKVLDGSFSMIDNSDSIKVSVLGLPKFKITYGTSLAKTLEAIGLKIAFENADFGGITKKEQLEISDVIHKAFVQVDEQGTEAAAATAVIMCCRPTSRKPRSPSISFVVDQPFMFLITHTPTRQVLFEGLVTRPQ